MTNKKSHALIPVILCVILLSAAAVVLLYGSVMMGYFREDRAAKPPTEAMTTETVAEEATAAPTEAEQGPAAEPVTESAAEAAADAASEASAEPESEATEMFAELPDAGEFPELTLVNAAHPLPDDHAPELAVSEDGFLFDARAVDALLAMLAGARAEGLSPMICSAYRPMEKQWELYNEKVAELVNEFGYSVPEAEATAKTIIAYPGTSEHNLGLAADVVAAYYDVLDRTQADTPEAKWLTAHCQEYGFILRYPENKSEITGVIYEPWHFRYVGKDAAREIMERGICLEEYLTAQ